MNQWQTWSALTSNPMTGGWWDALGNCTPGAPEGSSTPGVCSLATLEALLPSDATISADWNNNGGVQILMGYADQSVPYNGYVDNVTINGTTYDFEYAPEPGTVSLLAIGLAAAGVWRLRRARSS
ncbi:MAG TPA: PEP-CTERM sorting domain-containing protein [Bryobacteraceae bacterium]|nr:PEP-CTERM sorting domain-containing protein [Bryobacteraceae bacterium]